MKVYLIAFAFMALLAFSGVESMPRGQREADKGPDEKDKNDGYETTQSSDVTEDEDSSSAFYPDESSTPGSTETTSDKSTSATDKSSTTGEESESTTEESSSPTTSNSPASEKTTGQTSKSSEPASESPVPRTTDKLATSTDASSDPTKAMPTQEPTVAPSHRGESSFDGWSFFGGILLTVGLSTVSFVGYKYYKARSGSGSMNYNRF